MITFRLIEPSEALKKKLTHWPKRYINALDPHRILLTCNIAINDPISDDWRLCLNTKEEHIKIDIKKEDCLVLPMRL